MSKPIITERIIYAGESRIKPDFEHDPLLIKVLRILPGFSWSPTLRCWHIHDIINYISYLNKTFGNTYRFLEKKNKTRLKPYRIVIYHQEYKFDKKLYLHFKFNAGVIDFIKTLNNPYWHANLQLWSISGSNESFRKFILKAKQKDFKIIERSLFQLKNL